MQVISKNSREEIRVELAEYNGQPVLNARIWWKDDSGTFFPSKKGLTFNVKHLPSFADAINATLEGARDKGLTGDAA